MSKRAYPQDPSVPRQGTFPGGSGGYPGQGSYQGPTSQPGPPGGPQPPGGSGYPRQHYPAPGPSQGWVPSSSSNYGPGQPVHGGYNASQGQHHYTGGSYQPGPPRPPGPPAGQTQPPGPPTGQIRPPGPPTGQTRPAGPPSATSMMGPPPPTVGVSSTPPTSVASMTTGVGQIHLGHQPAGMMGHPPLSNQPPTSTSLAQGPPPTQHPPLTAPGAPTQGQGTQEHKPLSQMSRPTYPPPPSAGQGTSQQLPPPPTSSGQPSLGQGLPPPPTSSGQPSLGQGLPPPPTSSGQPSLGQGLPPPPTVSGQPLLVQGIPPPPTSSGLGHPVSVPQMMRYPPPPTGSGPPPPAPSGHVTGSMLPPPPTLGQPHPSLGQAPPTSRPMGPPPPSSGQLPGRYPSGPPMGSVPGPHPPTGPTVAMSRGQPGVPPPTPPYSQPGSVAQSDPNLQPVNLMESRNIIPSSPVVPPRIALPNNMSRFAPDHRVFCCTLNTVPATNSLLNKLKLPFAIHIHPFKDMTHNDCPVIHPSVIVRCRMCRAYINPYVTFIDSTHWRCNLCFRPNKLPDDFDYNPHSGKRGDRSHRVELKRSSVEYIAPSEYMVRPPQPCVFYFLIDVSFNAVQTGLLGVMCKCLLENLDRLPGDARTMVGVLTYDSSLHFYNLNSDLSQPQMLVVSDIDDVFLPCPDSLLVTLKDSKELVRHLLEDLPRMFADNKSVHSALGAALQVATRLLHAVGGRITVLQSSIPNIGPGALKYRDVTPSSTKIDTLCMSPASDFYKKLALDCSSQQIAVDLFAFGGQFMDLTTISCISKFSSGQVFYYPDFHHKREVPREKFEKDFKRYLTRKIGFEAVMRIRCTDGLSLHTFHGNFFVRSTDLLSLPNVNPDHGFTMNLAIDESLKDISMVCFQAALLYTSSRGERRIRVHSLSLPVSNQLSDVYAKLNIQAITGVLGNMAVDRAASSNLGDAREALLNTVIDATKMYRSSFASSMQASQFTLPATLRLLPLFMISLLKSPAFCLNSKVAYDFRTHLMNIIKSSPLDYLMCLIYPRLYALHMLTENCSTETDDGKEELAPPILQLSSEKMTRYGIFLMDYGLGIYIWVSKDAPQALVQKIFGVPHFGAIPEVMTTLPQEENDINPLVNKLVKQIRASRQIFVPLQVIREDGPHRLQFIDKMIDDRTEYGTSYFEFLTHISRQLSK